MIAPMRISLIASCLVSVLMFVGCGESDVKTASSLSASASTNQIQASARQDNIFRVPSGAMEPTLPIGARVVVSKGHLVVGDIVVVHPPQGFELEECGPSPHVIRAGGAACDTPVPRGSTIETVRRIVAGPGDEIYIYNGHVYRRTARSREFVREDDPYIRACGTKPECDLPIAIKIPEGYWFLMGDNRGASDDSRQFGPVPTEWIVGLAKDPMLRGRSLLG